MRFLLSLFGICFALSVNAQHALNGKIIDQTDMGVSSATIQLLNTDSVFITGSVSDGEGNFSIPKIKEGSYILSVSYIGYISQSRHLEMPNKDHSLPPITLKEDNVALDAVVVTGSSFIQKKDHLLVIPDKNQIKHAFSGYDLLYNLMIPGLNVDRRKKTVTAMVGEAVLYINGVKSDMREIQNLQPKDIERVEYYTLPTTGQFVGDAAAINYITKVHKSGGYVTLDGEQTIGYTKGDYNVGAKLTQNNTSYTFFGGYNMKKYDGVEVEKNEELVLQDYTIDRNTVNNEAEYKANQQYAQFKVSNDTKKHNLSAAASFVRNSTPNDDRKEILTYTGNDPQTVQSFDGNEAENMRGSINLNGVFNVNEQQRWNIRLNGGYTKNTYDRIYKEEPQISHTHANEDLYSFDTQIAYTYEPNKSNSFYSRITHFHNVTSSSYSGDYTSWQHLWKGESLLMIDYTHSFSDRTTMMISPGVSLMNYKLHGTDLQTSWNFRTNAWVRQVINAKQWIGVGFMLGNNQPSISYLNTSSQTIDFYQIKRGNPYLDNAILYQWYTMYEGQYHRLFNLQLKLWYTKDTHNTYTDYYREGDKLINSYASDDSYDTANGEISITSRISDNLRINAGFKYQYMYVPDRRDLVQHNYVGSFDVNYFIKSFAINAYVKTQEKILDQATRAFLKNPATYGLSVRYSGKRWMVEAGTENPFTKHLYYNEYADYGAYKYTQAQTSRIYQQTGYIKLAYTFDFGKKTSRDSNNVDKSINSAILKAR